MATKDYGTFVWALYDSGGGAEPGRGKGDGHSDRRPHKVRIGYRECGNADGVGDVAITVTATAAGGTAHGDRVTLIVQ
jgi:hypothetical protein